MFYWYFPINSIFVSTVYAHGVGQPSFFKINGRYAGYNDILIFSPFFDVPQDKAPENYLVNQELKFEIDIISLEIPADDLKEFTFYWDFGDGSTASGLKNTHKYVNPGSYVVNITFSYNGDKPQLFESVVVQILPYKEYYRTATNMPMPIITLTLMRMTHHGALEREVCCWQDLAGE